MSTTYDLLYRGGVSKENNIRYLTAETPPTDDNSNKVPTTEWVQEKMDDVEAAVSGGMFPKIQTAVLKSGQGYYTPSGGTWWYFYAADDSSKCRSESIAGNSLISHSLVKNASMCIKIA